MTETEMEICERFGVLRKLLKQKQGDFAKEIKLTQGHVSDIENKRKGVSDRVIEIICLKFNVNEEWLRCGEGEMFIELDRDEELAGWFGKVLGQESAKFKRRFLGALSRMDESGWIALEKVIDELHDDKDID